MLGLRNIGGDASTIVLMPAVAVARSREPGELTRRGPRPASAEGESVPESSMVRARMSLAEGRWCGACTPGEDA
jgi:hypothetical protein